MRDPSKFHHTHARVLLRARSSRVILVSVAQLFPENIRHGDRIVWGQHGNGATTSRSFNGETRFLFVTAKVHRIPVYEIARSPKSQLATQSAQFLMRSGLYGGVRYGPGATREIVQLDFNGFIIALDMLVLVKRNRHNVLDGFDC